PAWTDEFPAGDGYGSGQGHHRADTCVCNQHWDTEELRKATLTQTLRGVRQRHTHTDTHTHTHTRLWNQPYVGCYTPVYYLRKTIKGYLKGYYVHAVSP